MKGIKNALRETATVEYLENNEIVQLDDSEGGIQKSAKKLIPNDEFVQNHAHQLCGTPSYCLLLNKR